MEQDKSQVYNTYQAFLSAGRFNYTELQSLFAMNRPMLNWEDGVLLQTVVHNISLGRPTAPSLVDAIVAERARESLKTLYTYSIQEQKVVNDKCRSFTVLITRPGRIIGSFDAVMATPNGGDSTWDWAVGSIDTKSLKIHSIAEPGFSASDDLAKLDFESRKRFSSYTIFDNITQAVELDNMGTHYLQNLEEQIEQFAGEDMRDLFHKFRGYADCMLEMEKSTKLWVRYNQVGKDQVKLDASVYTHQTGYTYRTDIVQFNQVLNKAR